MPTKYLGGAPRCDRTFGPAKMFVQRECFALCQRDREWAALGRPNKSRQVAAETIIQKQNSFFRDAIFAFFQKHYVQQFLTLWMNMNRNAQNFRFSRNWQYHKLYQTHRKPNWIDIKRNTLQQTPWCIQFRHFFCCTSSVILLNNQLIFVNSDIMPTKYLSGAPFLIRPSVQQQFSSKYNASHNLVIFRYVNGHQR